MGSFLHYEFSDSRYAETESHRDDSLLVPEHPISTKFDSVMEVDLKNLLPLISLCVSHVVARGFRGQMKKGEGYTNLKLLNEK